MALTPFQRELCQLLAQRRRENGESYVAGGTALNTWTGARRVSRDIDLFHDTQTALQATWEADQVWLREHGYGIDVLRERPAYVEAFVRHRDDGVLVQWVQDSAFRFFPLIDHPDLGLTLHPLDLAANKLLAMVGRLEVRDWVDMVHSHRIVQPLGFLAWAACGKDPVYSPLLILEEASRSSHYSEAELDELEWEGQPPNAFELASSWKAALGEARALVAELPLDHIGECILGVDGALFRGTPEELRIALSANRVYFHQGSIRGAWPQLRP